MSNSIMYKFDFLGFFFEGKGYPKRIIDYWKVKN